MRTLKMLVPTVLLLTLISSSSFGDVPFCDWVLAHIGFASARIKIFDGDQGVTISQKENYEDAKQYFDRILFKYGAYNWSERIGLGKGSWVPKSGETLVQFLSERYSEWLASTTTAVLYSDGKTYKVLVVSDSKVTVINQNLVISDSGTLHIFTIPVADIKNLKAAFLYQSPSAGF
jgi:hypothetical protein